MDKGMKKPQEDNFFRWLLHSPIAILFLVVMLLLTGMGVVLGLLVVYLIYSKHPQ